jgi:UDP-2,3-diacylglucosamine pyrophosphatase LpxH
MSPTPNKQTFRFRTVFISDIHLGFRGCSAAYLLDFLRSVETETLYLVGDIIDVWSLRKSFFWPQAHNDVIRTILGKGQARHARRLHSQQPRRHVQDYDGMVFGNVEIRREGDPRDRRWSAPAGPAWRRVRQRDQGEARCSKRSAIARTVGVLKLNRYVNLLRRAFGAPYWSIAAYLKHKVKNAVKYIANFERALAQEAQRRGLDGAICGHNRAEISHIDGVLYCNDGDWVESCTTLT